MLVTTVQKAHADSSKAGSKPDLAPSTLPGSAPAGQLNTEPPKSRRTGSSTKQFYKPGSRRHAPRRTLEPWP